MSTIIKKTFPILGMHCASCKALIEKVTSSIDGVKEVKVNFANERVLIEYDEAKTSLENIAKIISSAGPYKLIINKDSGKLVSPGTKEYKRVLGSKEEAHSSKLLNKDEYWQLKKRVIIIGILNIPFVIIMLQMFFTNHSFGNEIVFWGINFFWVFQFILTTIIMFLGGREFLRSAWGALKFRTTNMDTLIVLSTSVAWLFSTIVTFLPGVFIGLKVEPFFEAIAFIIFFVLLGRLIEKRAKGNANEAISKLLEFQVKNALVIRNGEEIELPIKEVIIGDLVIVKPGSKIPLDGRVVEGEGLVDQSIVTGESRLIEKNVGSKVIGSTINKSGSFIFKVEKIGDDTFLSQIIKLVEMAQMTTPPVQKLVDKISSIFVPTIIVIAIFAFIFWLIVPQFLFPNLDIANTQLAFYVFSTILIIACPCALGLATPVAIMVATGRSAQKGILIKDMKALELMNKASTIVFDKTGTLTKGQPQVESITLRNNEFKIEGKKIDESTLLKYVSALESKSEHPLSKAIIEKAKKLKIEYKSLKVKNFKSFEGRGISGEINRIKIVVGNIKLFTEIKVSFLKELENEVTTYKQKGKTLAFVSMDNVIVGLISLSDTIRDETKEVISQIKKRGVKTIMLSGDNKRVAEILAESIGIDEVIAGVLPSEKSKKIQELQQGGEIVAMVGDGINDAPALAQADIGIAMGTGTDIAIESGDVVLSTSSLNKVLELIDLSEKSIKIIQENLFWAFGYNIIAIPIASGVLFPFFGILLSPVIASIAMAFSSISVVLNSLRLKNI